MNRILNVFALIAIGLSIGWMVGMSVSPVVQTVIASVLTLLISVISLLAGMPDKSASPPKAEKSIPGTPTVETHVLGNVITVLVTQPAPHLKSEQSEPAPKGQPKPAATATIALWPVAMFILFLAIGSALGVFTRTNHLLGVDAPAVAHKWTSNKTDSLLILRHLYRQTYGDYTKPSVGPLYDDGLRNKSEKGSDCDEGYKKEGVDLWNWVYAHVETKDTARINNIATNDTLKLHEERDKLCH
jgi:hypothetical protein